MYGMTDHKQSIEGQHEGPLSTKDILNVPWLASLGPLYGISPILLIFKGHSMICSVILFTHLLLKIELFSKCLLTLLMIMIMMTMMKTPGKI